MMGKKPVAEMLLLRRFGPRTDVRYMTKVELFKSGTQFLGSGLVVLAGALGLALLVPEIEKIQPEIVGVSGFAVLIISGMGILGGLYLYVRGAFRSTSYDPEAVWQADREGWIAKHGDDGDGPRRPL